MDPQCVASAVKHGGGSDSLGMFAGSDKGGHFDESKVYLGLWSINGFCDFCFDSNCLFALLISECNETSISAKRYSIIFVI